MAFKLSTRMCSAQCTWDATELQDYSYGANTKKQTFTSVYQKKHTVIVIETITVSSHKHIKVRLAVKSKRQKNASMCEFTAIFPGRKFDRQKMKKKTSLHKTQKYCGS